MQDDDESGVPAWVKYGVPIVLLIVALVGWRMRHASETVSPSAPGTQQVSEGRGAAEAARAGVSPPVAEPSSSSASSSKDAPRGPRSARQVFQEVSRSIVRVVLVDPWGNPTSQGSGVVVGRGEVITNCHVVDGPGSVELKVGLDSYPAAIATADKKKDLCRLTSHLDAPAVNVYGSMDLEPGERVYAIGAPRGLELTISEGIVSSLREVDGGRIVQTTAPVSPGSSGGGLFDNQARLVGIITFQRGDGQNLNFALPAEWIAEMRNSD